MKLKFNRTISPFLLAFICFLNFYNSYAQELKKTELDSVYALQAVHYKAKEYDKIIALSQYAKSLKLENAQDSITMARITAYIGYANNKMNTFYESIIGFEEALKYIPNEESKGIINTNYGILYDLLTRYYSLRGYKKALSVAEEAEKLLDNYDYIRASRYTWLYQRKFRIYSALGYFDKAALEVEKIKQKLTPITTETDEAMRYGWMRYYRSSLLLSYNEALFIKEQKEEFLEDIKPLQLNIEHNLAKLDSIYENTESLQVPKMRSQFSNLSLYVGALYYVSDFYKELEEFETSLSYIEKTIKLSKVAKEPTRNVTEFLRFKANVINELGDAQRAIELINDIEKNYDSNSFNLNDIYAFKGDIYAKNKQLDSTLFYYNKAIKFMHNGDDELSKDFQNFSTRYQFPSDCEQIDHMSNMLIVNFTDNNLALESAENFNEVAYKEFLNSHKNLDLSQGNKQLFYKIIEAKIYLNKDKIKDGEALVSNIENISNRLAWKKFSQSRNVVLLPVIDSLENIEYELRKQLLRAKKEKIVKQEDSINSILVSHQKNLAENYPILSDFTQDNFDFSVFQQLMDKNDVVLKYLFFYDQFAICQITKNEVSWDLKPWGKVERQLLEDHLAFLKDSNSKWDKKSDLTELLIPKGALEFGSITIIPDTPLYNLPFETLWHNNDFLLKEKAIHYSSHLRFSFFSNKETKTNKTKATIFAPNYPKGETSFVTRSVPVFLEGAQKEAKVLENLFQSTSFIGETATKENFFNNKSNGDILHLAMHASIDENDPTFSHFNFSNNENLYLEELYALKIPADLAVLSACNTGLGKVEDASGMASLQRAFNFAGTKATLASLWEVPDATTSNIMVAFYKHLKAGETKSVALQKAKLDYLSTTKVEKLKHPYYWAGFVLYGSDEAVTNTSNNWMWLILGSTLLLMFLIFLYKRKKP